MNGKMEQRVDSVQDLAYQSILIRTLAPKPGVMMCDDEVQMKEKLVSYLQCVFQVSNDQHQECLRIAETTMSLSTKIYLNCKLMDMQRTGVTSLDLKEYYVKWYLQSQPDLVQKGEIRNSIMISTPKTYEIENLIVDVFKKVDQPSPSSHDVKKLVYRSLIKNKLIGQVIIPLNTIPVSGLEMWYNLSDKNKMKHTTMVNIRVQFSTEEKSSYAIEEYKDLLKLILQFELKDSKGARFWWSGQFSDPAKMTLEQQSSGLSPSEIMFAKYAIYCEVHVGYELSFSIFTFLLHEVRAEIKSETVACEKFWMATKLLLPSCFLVVQKYFGKDPSVSVKTFKEALKILAIIHELKAADESALFSAEQYDLKLRTISAKDSKSWNLLNVLSDSIYTGLIRSFQTFCIEALAQAQSSEEKLNNLISIVQKVTEEIIHFKEQHNEYFLATFDYPLFVNLFKFYESELLNIVEPIVTSVSNEFKHIKIPNINPDFEKEEDRDEQSKQLILKLYFKLKHLVKFRCDQSLKNEVLKIDVYHKWFTNAITHKIDKILLDVICKMGKIFEKDDLIDIGSGDFSYSSSAFDTCTIILQFTAFWKELEFSDAEESYIIILKIFDDITTCLRYYSDELIKRIADFPNDLILVEKTCLVINNIEYLRTQLSPTTQNFSTKEIIKKMYGILSPRKVRKCSSTLERITVNADEIKSTRIVQVTDALADKMLLNFVKLLSKGLTANDNSESMTELLEYLDESHKLLFKKINETYFNAVVDRLWPAILNHMHDLIMKKVKKQKSFSFFERLRNLFGSMSDIFAIRNKTSPKITYQDQINLVEDLLRLHSYKTTELIHKYYLDRYKERQLEEESVEVGEIMVNCYFQDNELKVDVMNARKIIPLDAYRDENDCNPYVRVEVFGPDGDMGIKKQLTETCYKTRTPLFDQCLIKPIIFTPEQKEQKDTLIILTLKESQMYGFRKFYMSEAMILLGDIVSWHPGLDLDSCGITKLSLRRAKYVDNKYLRILEKRKNDKQAEQFIYKLKNITNYAVSATNEQPEIDKTLADVQLYRMSI